MHLADTPWKWERISDDDESDEAIREGWIRKIRLILNRITSSNEDALTKEFIALQMHLTPCVKDVVCTIFERAAQDVEYREIYSRLCSEQVRQELSNTTQSRFRNEIQMGALNLLTGKFEMKYSANGLRGSAVEFSSALNQQRMERKWNDRQWRFGSIRFLGHLYLQEIISHRVMHVFVADLLKSVNRNKSGNLPARDEVDNESVAAAVVLLELVCKRLEEEKASFLGVLFFLGHTFFTLKDAMEIVAPRTRYLIMSLFELREERWGSRRTRWRIQIREEIRNDTEKRSEDE